MHARAAVCAALVGSAAGAVEPLGLRTPGTLRELFLDVTGADARALPALRLDVRWTIANDWGMPTVLFRGDRTVLQQLDEQADALTASLRMPWARLLRAPWAGRVCTALEARLTLHWGGWTDRPIEVWHDLTGAFNFNRGFYQRNEVHVLFGDVRGAVAFDLNSGRLAFGDLVARTQVLLAEGGVSAAAGPPRPSWGLSLRFDLKAPTGLLSRAGGSGGWDAGAALLGTAELAPWLTGHALIAASAFSSFSTAVSAQPRTWHGTIEVSLAATAGAWTFFLEDRLASPLLEGGWQREEAGGNDGLLASAYFGSFRWHNQLTLGLRRGPFSFWISEDFTPGPNPRATLRWLYNTNAPDLVFGFGYRKDYR